MSKPLADVFAAEEWRERGAAIDAVRWGNPSILHGVWAATREPLYWTPAEISGWWVLLHATKRSLQRRWSVDQHGIEEHPMETP